MTAGWPRAAARVAAAVVLGLAGGCATTDDDPGPTLRAPGSGSSGGTLPDTPVGTSIILWVGALCTSGGPIRIDAVDIAGATGGLHITSWGTRHLQADDDLAEPNAMYGRGQVTSIDGFGTDRPVSSRCTGPGGKDDSVDQFDVSVAARTPRATMTGVTVHYGSGRSVFVGFDFALCSSRACASVDPARVSGR